MQIDGNVAIVTGGASGLGLAAGKRLASAGAKVALWDLDGDGAARAAHELGENALGLSVDVSDAASAETALAATTEAFGAVHFCVNCAGVATGGRAVGRDGPLPLEKFTRVIEINLIGTFNVLRLAAGEMVRNTPDEDGARGVIVNTASVAAFDGQIGQAAYSASKAGVAGMSLPLAREMASLGIRVNSIAPGVFETPMMAAMSDEVRAPLIATVQYPKRFGEPDEFASLVEHIIGNRYLNGETIRLDAAIRMPPR
ncbi:MAG: SDR family NAD(P)-dependent oxidoreductase [Gammaproteobacteria bacterium]|nr:SDR family NAD(P)-dependent oxidoreductase [Gammaproteobacteria bacterium]